jgi:protein associated with RNAse G/E
VEILVIKCNTEGQETWRYRGQLVEQDSNRIVLEAYFDRQDMILHGMMFGKGDRFVETYYTDRWYNLFEIHAREDDRLRGWYCNITRPATFDGLTITYEDLALDLLVFPDGRQIILDEDEFLELDVNPDVKRKARQALEELQAKFNHRI